MTSTPPDRSQGPRRALAVALPGGAIGAAAVLVASGQTWGEGTAAFGTGTMGVEVSGSEVSGVPSALALVGLAALVAVFAVRRAGRAVVAGLLTLSGLGVMVAALAGSSDTDALDEKAAEATGLADATVSQVSHTVWPYVAAAGGFLLLVAGVLALRYGRSWPAMGGRYERGGERAARRRTARPADPERPEEMWQALDRGEASSLRPAVSALISNAAGGPLPGPTDR